MPKLNVHISDTLAVELSGDRCFGWQAPADSAKTTAMYPLDRLHNELRACRLCADEGYHIVPGAVMSGVSSARVMTVGQAPGVTEVQVKRPFNAGSGRRLFQWLGTAGWDEATFRSTHYMTSVTKCFPGKHAGGKGDRVPTKAEQALCRPFLEREIALVDPKLMILIGGLAIKLVFPASMRLNQLIGSALYLSPDELEQDRVHLSMKNGIWQDVYDPSFSKEGRWIVPLPHPSGASLWPNRPENKALISQAINLLADIRQDLDL